MAQALLQIHNAGAIGVAPFSSAHKLSEIAAQWRSNALPNRLHSSCSWSRQATSSSTLRNLRLFVPRAGDAYGENPDWSPEDFIVVGLGHCFMEDGNGKLKDFMVIEPIAAGALECMENGGKTCYKHIVGTTLGVALKQDPSLLPQQFQCGKFASEFDFRAKCAARNWKREYPTQQLRRLAPMGEVRSDFNFSLEDKRVLNMVNVVTDEDNIKQDLSIDVYGRAKDEEKEEFASQISSLYNV